MNFKELIEKLKESGNGSNYLLKMWLDDLHIFPEINYNNIYGFIRGLYAADYISEEDEQSLINLLLQLVHDKY